ncbi:MAG: N-acetyl sugar amidotransferase [Nitrosarchaeum sp.]|nr:N-acetyl sugar amidotransferase [Nitrosarchaeum sp.]MCA9819715.1 N-acetyl sugar amidotransferase [Nitrosarchaeum sp.]
MPDTRPGLTFDNSGVCAACINFEKQKSTDWDQRWSELEKLCEQYRGSNGKGYDCAIAISGGKDSHFQTYIMKEKLKMNPLLISVGNVDWTETGRKNLDNISDAFGCDIISFQPNIKIARKLFRRAFEKLGSPTWYVDSLIYAFPLRMCIKLGIKLLVYGEDVNYTYGGEQNKETPSALMQPYNDVVKPVWDVWFEDGDITEEDLESAKMPPLEDVKKAQLNPIYLSYYVPWSSVHNFEVAKRWGFRHLGHEYVREGSIDNYDQVDSIPYMLNPYMKYPKFGHSVATDNASRWIRYGLKTREEMIPIVEETDAKLDQGIVDKFCKFTGMTHHEFWLTMDKWYNRDLFSQDRDGVWHPKFTVGQN